MIQPTVSYKRHRFPPSVIARAVWLYFRFSLSLRLVEEMLLERGIVVSHETIRCWAKKFGPDHAGRLRRKPPSPSDIWHLDEVVVTIGGKGDVTLFHQRPNKAFACELKQLRRSRLSTAPLRGSDECGWRGLSVSGAVRRKDFGLLKRER